VAETILAGGILAGPLLAALLLGVCPPLRRAGRAAGLVALLGSGVALVLAVRLGTWLWLVAVRSTTEGVPPVREVAATVPWLPQLGGAPLATAGVWVDPLSSAMAVLVTLVAFLVQLYSLGYLAGEPPGALGRYYFYQSLFAFAMLGLVFAPNLLQLFVFWELVGLCSYLLIGFYYRRPAAAAAAVKAFWVTKLGDVGLVLGIVLLWGATGTFELAPLLQPATAQVIGPGLLALALGLMFLGAAGKSAQFPLHVWLPDAMEGPTPVSALIHAATMVTAGVFLVSRTFPLYQAVPGLLVLVAWIGALTAFLAATLALAQTDIKRVLAYSTVSQLGYMMAALGAGALAAGVLHLLTHGIFKALLFLAAGAVIHAVHTNDLREMGGLGRALPKTTGVFLVGALALAGLPPLAGFVSKEAVLAGVWEAGLRVPFGLLGVTVFLTALYMGRVIALAFFGSPARPPAGPRHDPPAVMMGPLWLLATGAFAAAALGTRWPGISFAEFLAGPDARSSHGPPWLLPVSVGLAAGGLVLAWLVYGRRVVSPETLRAMVGPWAAAAAQGYGLDAVYERAYRRILLAVARAIGWVDRYLVDGVVNWASAWTLRGGVGLRRLQTGRAQDYLLGVTAGFVLVLMLWSLWP
jgi:NADH-quinone oxidoreductase subunit L